MGILRIHTVLFIFSQERDVVSTEDLLGTARCSCWIICPIKEKCYDIKVVIPQEHNAAVVAIFSFILHWDVWEFLAGGSHLISTSKNEVISSQVLSLTGHQRSDETHSAVCPMSLRQGAAAPVREPHRKCLSLPAGMLLYSSSFVAVASTSWVTNINDMLTIKLSFIARPLTCLWLRSSYKICALSFDV